jgi:hypothetical protein
MVLHTPFIQTDRTKKYTKQDLISTEITYGKIKRTRKFLLNRSMVFFLYLTVC